MKTFGFEALEKRDVCASLNGSVLEIRGTAAADRIDVREANGSIVVNQTGRAQQIFQREGLTRIRILAGAGNDRVSMEGVTIPGTIRGGAGADVLVGGAVGDSIYGDAGHDRLGGRDGDDLLVGGAGGDRMNGHRGRDTIDSRDGVFALGWDEIENPEALDVVLRDPVKTVKASETIVDDHTNYVQIIGNNIRMEDADPDGIYGLFNDGSYRGLWRSNAGRTDVVYTRVLYVDPTVREEAGTRLLALLLG